MSIDEEKITEAAELARAATDRARKREYALNTLSALARFAAFPDSICGIQLEGGGRTWCASIPDEDWARQEIADAVRRIVERTASELELEV